MSYYANMSIVAILQRATHRNDPHQGLTIQLNRIYGYSFEVAGHRVHTFVSCITFKACRHVTKFTCFKMDYPST